MITPQDIEDSRFEPQSLDPRWLEVVSKVSPQVLGHADRQNSALVSEIADLSELYNRRRDALPSAVDRPAARLRFFFLRDLPKISGPLSELARAGLLPEGPSWRVLDLGAGSGTTSLGLAHYAKRVLNLSEVQLTAIDRDAHALDVMGALVREANQQGLLPDIALKTRTAELERIRPRSLRKAHFILMGLALNEMFAALEPAERLERRIAFLGDLRRRLEPGGALIIVEPAHRLVSRELQRLRERLMTEPTGWTVFAPCLRTGPCPLLRRERDWCHDELPFELPGELGVLAKKAGLRSQRLTYSYLTLRADKATYSQAFPIGATRIVGGPRKTKGQVEWHGCGEPGFVRVRLQNRERGPSNVAIEEAARGSVLAFSSSYEDEKGLRLRPDVAVERLFR